MKMKKILVKLVRFYQKYLSPLKRRPTCRFYPTCSCYAIEAIETHGAFKGTFLSAKRILRCNPLFKGGVDLVPPKTEKKNKRNSGVKNV